MQAHVVDLAQKAMSPGELRNVAARVGGFEALIDREGKRYVDKGLKYAAPTGPRIEQMLIADPLLLRTPIVRAGSRATVGYVAGRLAELDRRSEEGVNDDGTRTGARDLGGAGARRRRDGGARSGGDRTTAADPGPHRR